MATQNYTSPHRSLDNLSAEWRNKYDANPKHCPACNERLPWEKRANKYCNQSCAAKLNNAGRCRNKSGKNGKGEYGSIHTGRVPIAQRPHIPKSKQQKITRPQIFVQRPTCNNCGTTCRNASKNTDLTKYLCQPCICARKRNRQSKCVLCNEPAEKNVGRYCSNCKISVRRYAMKKMAVEEKGGKCAYCGWTGPLVGFDFHHIGDKTDTISNLIRNLRSWVTIGPELEKCDLICCFCHRIEHAKVLLPQLLVEAEHGVTRQESKPVYRNGIKICRVCGKKPYRNKSKCASCQIKIGRWRTKRWARNQLGGKCNRCDRKGHMATFDFHHPAGDPDIRISKLRGKSRQAYANELKKCELLCVLCHRVHHAPIRSAEFLAEAERCISIITKKKLREEVSNL